MPSNSEKRLSLKWDHRKDRVKGYLTAMVWKDKQKVNLLQVSIVLQQNVISVMRMEILCQPLYKAITDICGKQTQVTACQTLILLAFTLGNGPFFPFSFFFLLFSFFLLLLPPF
jgi:hypothetical protein